METLKIQERWGFEVAPYVRICWRGLEIRELWQERITRLHEMFLGLRGRCISHGLGSFSTVTVPGNALPMLTRMWASSGTVWVVKNSYASCTPLTGANPTAAGGTFDILLSSSKEKLEEIDLALKSEFVLSEIYERAGWPMCCTNAYVEALRGGTTCTIWSAVGGRLGATQKEVVDLDTELMLNPFWVMFNIMPTFHKPCSVTCAASIEMAYDVLKLAQDEGFSDELKWLQQIRGWPVRWSAFHGIAEIETPILLATEKTDWTPASRTIKYIGCPQKAGAAYSRSLACGE